MEYVDDVAGNGGDMVTLTGIDCSRQARSPIARAPVRMPQLTQLAARSLAYHDKLSQETITSTPVLACQGPKL
jgi:hypothetical protein